MTKNRSLALVALIVCLSLTFILLYSCNGGANETDGKTDIDKVIDNLDTSINDSDVNTDYDASDAVHIAFSENGASVSGKGADAVGTDVTVTCAGTYVISGSCSDGSLTVDCGKGNEVCLILSGLELANSDGYAIYVRSGKKITVTLDKNSENLLSDGEAYEITDDDSTIDGTIFSKSDLVINGEGSLTVNGNNAHGIVCKDVLTIVGASVTVNSTSAGICGKDALKISNASITVKAGSDALRSDNDTDTGAGYIYVQSGTLELDAYNDGIQAYSLVIIEGGSFNISTSATSSSESSKGIKGGTGVRISGGAFTLDCEDDALHSDGDVVISGGDFAINTGDDGIHANDTLEISGGNIIINKSYEGIEGTNIIISGGYVDITSSDDGMNASGGNDANTTSTGRPGMDMFESTDGSITVSGGYIIIHNEGDGVDSNGSLEVTGGVILVDGPQSGGNGSFDYATTAKITGGVVITLGTSDMAQNFTEATQGSILVSSSGYFAAGTLMSLCDEDGNVILAFTSTKAFRGALFSAPELEKGNTYTFYMNADVSGLDENGYAHNTTQTGGDACGSVTIDDYISGQGSGMGGTSGGGRPGRPY